MLITNIAYLKYEYDTYCEQHFLPELGAMLRSRCVLLTWSACNSIPEGCSVNMAEWDVSKSTEAELRAFLTSFSLCLFMISSSSTLDSNNWFFVVASLHMIQEKKLLTFNLLSWSFTSRDIFSMERASRLKAANAAWNAKKKWFSSNKLSDEYQLLLYLLWQQAVAYL